MPALRIFLAGATGVIGIRLIPLLPLGARLDDHRGRLDHGGGRVAGLEAELLDRLARDQGDDPERPAGQLDLRDQAVDLNVDHGARQAVAGARVHRRLAVAQQPLELAHRQPAVAAAALELHAPLSLPPAQGLDAHPEGGGDGSDADGVVHAVAGCPLRKRTPPFEGALLDVAGGQVSRGQLPMTAVCDGSSDTPTRVPGAGGGVPSSPRAVIDWPMSTRISQWPGARRASVTTPDAAGSSGATRRVPDAHAAIQTRP